MSRERGTVLPSPLVECVMNVSEGRDAERVERIARPIRHQLGAWLLDCSSDPSHHRSVLTFAGEPESVLEAAFRAAAAAIESIDLNHHAGVHPRIGAVDVIPFVPLRGADMALCIELARRLGARLAAQLEVPVYLYARAALLARHRELAPIRKGGFEGLRRALETDPARYPDLGPKRLHPTAGATAVGARPILIAYNVILETGEVEVARQVAAAVRQRGGGLPGVQALGFYLAHRQLAQVSMNVTDYRRAPLQRVFDEVSLQARRHGVEVHSSEIVGLVPRAALPPEAEKRLRLEGPVAGRVLEERIDEVLGRSGWR